MTTTQMSGEQVTQKPTPATVDLKLEAVVIPVSDVDRAKRFYESLGWRLDADFARRWGLARRAADTSRITVLDQVGKGHDGRAWLRQGSSSSSLTSRPHAESSLNAASM